ncbi:MAG: hypothetical protein ABIT36_08995 [Steroidobacteraceae bacterium]
MVSADRDRIAGMARAAGSALAVHLESLGIVAELTNRQRGRVFSYRRYVDTLGEELEQVD